MAESAALRVDAVGVQAHEFAARWYLNGFPKSGLHLLTLMMRPVAQPQVEELLWTKPWAGTFTDNSWTDNWVSPEKVLYKISRLQDGRFLKGHCGYLPEIERFLWYAGISHVFVYRDLRDVAVSQSYHVVAEDDERWAHPAKGRYRALGSHQEVLGAVIEGLGDFPGVLDRWALYAPWLNVDWVCKVRFEDARADPHKIASAILCYGLERVAPLFGCKLNVMHEAFDFLTEAMVAASARTEHSPTFRKGTVGQWREEFTPEIKALFKARDTEHWLERLGYEQDDNW